MRKRTLIISILLLTVIVACSETQDAFYKNYRAAIELGAVERGWIPDILPKSSYEIYERHDLDTNTVWLRFKFNKQDINGLISKFEEVAPNEIGTIAFSSPNVHWWAKEINKDDLVKGRPGLKLYKFNRIFTYASNRRKIVPAFFVIDWESDIAFYWQYSS